jgi:chromosome segregation ATPase
MKNFQQNLLIVLALGLCVLCACQWYSQTREHVQLESQAELIHGQLAAIQDYTNSIASLNHQVDQMDARLTELKDTVKTNDQTILAQKREISRLQFTSEVLTNQIADYKTAVATLEGRLKDAYDGIQKQNDAIQTLTTQRDEFIQKLNDSVKDRNDIVAKYNELAARVEKMQTNNQ